MFRQIKSAFIWIYLYKFRNLVFKIFVILIGVMLVFFIYEDVVEYLKLINQLSLIPFVIIIKWGLIFAGLLYIVKSIIDLAEDEEAEEEERRKEEEEKQKEEERKIWEQTKQWEDKKRELEVDNKVPAVKVVELQEVQKVEAKIEAKKLNKREISRMADDIIAKKRRR